MNDNSEPGNNARIEAYLDQVLAPLTRRLSPFHRDELRRELRAHLWERVNAYRELGQSEDDAVTEALRQFGGAEDFLRQWQRKWMQIDQGSKWREILTASKSALLLCVPMLLLTWLIGYGLSLLISNGAYLGIRLIVYSDVFWKVNCVGFFCLAISVGVLQGRCAPRRSGMGMFAALGVIAAAGSMLFQAGIATGVDGMLLGSALTNIPLMAAIWLPLACTSATLTGWWTQKHNKRKAMA